MKNRTIELLRETAARHTWLISLVIVLSGIVGSLLGAYLLRFEFSFEEVVRRDPLLLLLPAILLKGFVFWRMSLFHGWWKYASLADVVEIFKATVYSSLLLTVFAVLVYRLEGIPRSVLVLDFVLTFCYLAGVRFGVRLIQEHYIPAANRQRSGSTNVLVVGAGEAGQSVVREIRKSPRLKMYVTGFLDDDPLKRNLKFQGVRVLGRIDEMGKVLESTQVDNLIVAIPGASGREMRRIVDVCNSFDLKVQTLPGISDLIDGRATIQQIRDVDVRDLLGRRSIELDTDVISQYVCGKRVLVTGAAGSIGSELCRQIVRFGPDELIVLDVAESPLFFLERELGETSDNITPILGDVRDAGLIDAVLGDRKPHIVFHAAAYKHVPLMEAHPGAAVSVNMLGTKTVADHAETHGVESFVMVSTDKAVRPANVMGATKRCAEMYIQGLDRKSSTRFMTVRFGNVLDSAGSVIPIFREQILNGGPVTVTHPEVTRFFMTIPEASQLVLQAACLGNGGEIFLLDMGESVKILYLAEEMIRLSGFIPHEDIEVVFTGLRPGEKLYEELLLDGEGILPTAHDAIKVASSTNIHVVDFLSRYAHLVDSSGAMTAHDIKKALKTLVHEYKHTEHQSEWEAEAK